MLPVQFLREKTERRSKHCLKKLHSPKYLEGAKQLSLSCPAPAISPFQAVDWSEQGINNKASRRKALRSLDLLRHDDMAGYKDVHARMAASVAARASAFAANIEAQICQLEIELPWLECLDAQATANSVLAGAV